MPNVPPKILLVDDEAAIRDICTLFFKTQGFAVRTASNALEALDLIYAQKFDLVILDLGLGDNNGLTLIEPIKIAQPEIPVFIYTANDFDDKTREEAKRLGVIRFLSKSHPLDYIAMEVKRALGLTGLRASSPHDRR